MTVPWISHQGLNHLRVTTTPLSLPEQEAMEEYLQENLQAEINHWFSSLARVGVLLFGQAGWVRWVLFYDRF